MARPNGGGPADGAGLSISELTVRFGGLTALQDVSLEVAPGEILGIVGPNGAGKTTLFNAICGFVRPTAGRIEYGGRALGRIRPHQLAGLGIARTLQGLGLWHGLTVLENVMAGAEIHARSSFFSALLGLPASDRDEARLRARARAALERLEIGRFADTYPAALPYGVQKRVVLARALVAEPSLLLLDEPVSGLAESEIESFGGLLRDVRDPTAIALVEHHMDFVMSICDRVVVLDFGSVVAAGAPEQVKSDPAVTVAYLGEEAMEADGPGG